MKAVRQSDRIEVPMIATLAVCFGLFLPAAIVAGVGMHEWRKPLFEASSVAEVPPILVPYEYHALPEAQLRIRPTLKGDIVRHRDGSTQPINEFLREFNAFVAEQRVLMLQRVFKLAAALVLAGIASIVFTFAGCRLAGRGP